MPRKPANAVPGVHPSKRNKKEDIFAVDSNAEKVSSSPPPTTGTTPWDSTRRGGKSNQSATTPVRTENSKNLDEKSVGPLGAIPQFPTDKTMKKEEIVVSDTNVVTSTNVPLPWCSSRKVGSQPNQSAASQAPVAPAPLNIRRIDKLFTVYADKNSCHIGPEGIESLCADLGVHHTDVRILMLAWKMKSERQGYFSQEEWRRGLMALDATTIRKMKLALPVLEKEVRSPQNFRDFYKYAFMYCLTVDLQKTIDIKTASDLLKIVLQPHFPAQVNMFITFLMCQKEYKVISLDQWEFIPLFCNEIHFPSLDNYNSACAWPSIFDSFVEWMLEERRQS